MNLQADLIMLGILEALTGIKAALWMQTAVQAFGMVVALLWLLRAVWRDRQDAKEPAAGARVIPFPRGRRRWRGNRSSAV